MRFKTILIFVVYLFALIVIGSKLFFEEEVSALIARIRPEKITQAQTLQIGLSEAVVRLDPLANDIGSRTRLLHMFEPLIRVRPDLRLEPALAISYGVIDDTTWEFRIRPDVRFHDGTPLTFEDIEHSLLMARDHEYSGVRDLASTIQSIERSGDDLFHITTTQPDPLLPAKLSALLIFPARTSETPLGTGPYRYIKDDKDVLELESFDGYWGPKPAQSHVALHTLSTKQARIDALKKKNVALLQNVPPDHADLFPTHGYELMTMPGLEVNFLMFNFDGIFQDRRLREAVAKTIDREKLAKLGFGFATPVAQFVPNGVFGYDAKVRAVALDEELAKKMLAEIPGDHSIIFDVPQGLEGFGNNVKRMLDRVGFATTVRAQPIAELDRLLYTHESPFYFFGWRHDLADALDFLTAVVHSPASSLGQFNGGNYKNPEVDALIDQSRKTFDTKERLTLMRQALAKATTEDFIGIPLFAPEVLYAVNSDLDWTPRVDGFVLAQEIL